MKNNLIGISGKIQSGKDTVYDMICDITGIEYENKKFADKIKGITCLLIGCTREQLEDQDFKLKPLGDEWNLPRISLHQAKCESYDGNKIVFTKVITPRLIMQLIGTEGGRDLIHPNIWVNSLFADYNTKTKYEYQGEDLVHHNSLIGCGRYHFDKKEEVFDFIKDNMFFLYLLKTADADEEINLWYNTYVKEFQTFKNWIVTDVRFKNEVDAIKEKGGVVIRIERPCGKCGSPESQNEIHTSETELDDYTDFDYTIINDGNLDDLRKKLTKWIKS